MRIPGWLRAMTALVLLIVCCATVWYDFTLAGLEAQRQDLLTKLETSQGRERRQNMEYNRVLQALPPVQAQLAQVQPLADEAAAEETRLRQLRKELRGRVKELETALSKLQAVNATLRESVDQILQTQQKIRELATE